MSPADRQRQQVLSLLAEAGGSPVTGAVIADRVGCSRSVVQRHVEAIRRDGVEVLAGPSGYRLGPGEDPVVPLLVHPRLEPPVRGPIHWHREVVSTTDLAAVLAREGAPEGTVVGADHQTAGHGGPGHAWVETPGTALLAAVVLRPPMEPHHATLLPILASVAVAEAVEARGLEAVTIAWPNDVLVGGRKLASVLCRISSDHDEVAWAVLGMGLNVRPVPPLEGVHFPPTSLADNGIFPHRRDVLAEVLVSLARCYRGWRTEGDEAVLGAFARRDHLVGRMVHLATPEGEVEGQALGLDGLGHLRVRTRRGERVVPTGEVTSVSR